MLLIPGTANGERETGVWERVYSGNPLENKKWQTKEKKRLQCGHLSDGTQLSGMQRSKLRPFWSPWRVEKNFGDQNSGESRVMETLLPLKVTKRQLFEKVSLERWLGSLTEKISSE